MSLPLRHPEKGLEKRRGKIVAPALPRPPWIRAKAPVSQGYLETRAIARAHGLVTVCEEAACPNIGECWAKGHATFMILGAVCTRACAFCHVATGKPKGVDAAEPERVAAAVRALGLLHVVVTSVDRDDLADGGAEQFCKTVAAIRASSPSASVEILTPDFRNKAGALETVLRAPPDVFNHNIETVPRLYPSVRPGSRYFTSLSLLERAKECVKECTQSRDATLFTKSGLMVGLGESDEEVFQVMDDLRAAGVDFLTIGQYLRPTAAHAAVCRYVSPQGFARLRAVAQAKGFLMVAATPMTRSSYHAGEDFAALRKARIAQTNSPN